MPDPTHPPFTGRQARATSAGEVARPAAEADTTGVARSAAAWLGAFSTRDAPAALALAVLVVVSYFPALPGGFVWDDRNISEEPVIHSLGGLRSIWLAPAEIRNEVHYWPLIYSSFWLEHKLWGLRPAGYHAVNIVLHLLNCLLLWRLLLRLRVPGALLIAAVFAVHPLHVESVAWIIERKDVLSALFYLGAVLAWLRFVEVERAGHYLLAALLFVAGLLSKSVVVTLPLALLLVQWWRGGRVTRLDLLRVAPLMVIGAAITAASRIALQQRPESADALANVGAGLVHFERFAEAEPLLRRALELDPRSTSAHQSLGEALRKQGRHRQALESYRAAGAIDPRFALAYAGMGRSLFATQRYAEALAALQQASARPPRHGVRPRATLCGGVAAVSRAGRDRPRQRADSRQHWRRALSTGPPAGGAGEPRARAGPEPGPGSDPHHPGSGARAPPATVAIYADPQTSPIPPRTGCRCRVSGPERSSRSVALRSRCPWRGAAGGRGPLAGALYFALTLGPVLGFVHYGYMPLSFVADRSSTRRGSGVLAVLLGGTAHGVDKLAARGSPHKRRRDVAT